MGKPMKTFEEFLQDKHGENYNGTDDDMSDAFDNWVSNLDTQEVMDYAESYGREVYKSGYDEGFEAGQASNIKSD